jgi:hydrogenase maturation protease
MNVTVLGLGNPIRQDDGIGIHAIRKLAGDTRLPKNVQVIDGGTLGLDLLPRLRGVSHLLALDAVDTGAPPGALSKFIGAELLHLPISKSVHLLGFADLLGALAVLEDVPLSVTLLGIQPESTDWGIALSPIVERALSDLIDAALGQICDWSHSTEERRALCASPSPAR